jgi:hypothetical protein
MLQFLESTFFDHMSQNNSTHFLQTFLKSVVLNEKLFCILRLLVRTKSTSATRLVLVLPGSSAGTA